MTTITIKDNKKLPKTDFQSLEDFLDWAVDYFQEDAPLSPETIQKAENAQKEISSPNSTFRPVS